MNELVAWLRAQLDEDAQVVRDALGTFRHDAVVSDAVHIYLNRHDPARVLAEVAAKRRIIDRCEQYARWAANDDAPGFQALEAAGEHMLRLLASVYAGRPGWRSEWAPDEEVSRG